MKMRIVLPALALAFALDAGAREDAIKALLLTGGGYHDYDKQKTILTEGLDKRLDVAWTIIHKDAAETKELLSESGWHEGFDVIVYNICHADETDADFVKSVTEVHEAGLPAVVIHCTLHSYHWKTNSDDWVRFLGVTSMRHGRQAPIHLEAVKADHPILEGLPEKWTTPNGELYHIAKVWPSATVLAEGSVDGNDDRHAVVWTNEFGKARVFGTSIGHHNETMADERYLDLVARGLLWATDRFGANAALRVWTNRDGREIEARLVEVLQDRIVIENRDGKRFTIDPATLSDADQQFVRGSGAD